MVRLDKRWARHLACLPETRMGYRIVDIDLCDGRTVRGVTVIAGEHVTLPQGEEFDPDHIEAISIHVDTPV